MSKADGYPAGTAAAAEKELGARDLERVVTAPQLPMAAGKDEELVAVDTAASERLPFSKARCVALVTTIAAAPFLSVRTMWFADLGCCVEKIG